MAAFKTTKSLKILALLACALTMPIQAVQAATLYVGDNLRVGIRNSPGSNEASLAVISSGATVELLERRGSHIKIRTRSGLEGWVKAAYFTDEKPAMLRLAETRKKLKELKTELAELKNSSPQQAALLQQYKQEIENLRREKTELQQSDKSDGSSAIVSDNISPEQDNDLLKILQQQNSPLGIIALAVLVMLSSGFLLGVGWYKRQVTKRLGGLSL